MTSENNPENGTTTYFWDKQPSGLFVPQNFPGNLAAKQDNLGVYTCYSYDGLNRYAGWHKEGHAELPGLRVRLCRHPRSDREQHRRPAD